MCILLTYKDMWLKYQMNFRDIGSVGSWTKKLVSDKWELLGEMMKKDRHLNVHYSGSQRIRQCCQGTSCKRGQKKNCWSVICNIWICIEISSNIKPSCSVPKQTTQGRRAEQNWQLNQLPPWRFFILVLTLIIFDGCTNIVTVRS